MIRFANVSKSFDNNQTYIVKDVSLTIESGEMLVILGSSGAGKSTILKMINRLVLPTAGTIKIDGRDIREFDAIELRRSMGYVFQGVGLFPHLTVAENVAVMLRLMKQPRDIYKKRAYELLDLVGLPPDIFADRYPAGLSGGQQQRVGVARALAADPNYLLMDEPFGALDAVTRNDLQEEIIRLKKELNKTIIFVTHDVFEAIRLADRLAVMHNGKLEQIGYRDELIRSPATPFVNELLQKTAQQIKSYAEHFA